MKWQHDKHMRPSRQYKPGDWVYLDAMNVRTTCASKKLNAKFHGPFKILLPVGRSSYKLELPTGWTIHDVFCESKLKPAHESQFLIQKETRPWPPPDIIDGNEEHKVEEVKKVHLKAGQKEFLIKWKGLPQEETPRNQKNTWWMHNAWFETFIKLILMPSEKHLSLLPLPTTFPSWFPPILPSPILNPSFLSILLTLIFTDGMVNSSMNTTTTSSTNCGTTGKMRMKKLTQRTEGGLSPHTY